MTRIKNAQPKVQTRTTASDIKTGAGTITALIKKIPSRLASPEHVKIEKVVKLPLTLQ